MTNILNLEKIYPSLSIAKEKPQGIAIHSCSKIEFMDIDDIIYCQAEGNYCHIYTDNGKRLTSSKTLKYFETKIESNKFLRVHRSYLVNMGYLDSYLKNENSIELENGTLIPVSRSGTKHFFDWIDAQYIQ